MCFILHDLDFHARIPLEHNRFLTSCMGYVYDYRVEIRYAYECNIHSCSLTYADFYWNSILIIQNLYHWRKVWVQQNNNQNIYCRLNQINYSTDCFHCNLITFIIVGSWYRWWKTCRGACLCLSSYYFAAVDYCA